MRVSQCLAVVWLAITIAISSSEKLFRPNSQNMQVCSDFLADTMSLVCNGKYNEWRPRKQGKKSVPFDNGHADEYYDQQGEDSIWPFLTKKSAAAMLVGAGARPRRQWNGIVDECCRKSCNYDEMKSYCAD